MWTKNLIYIKKIKLHVGFYEFKYKYDSRENNGMKLIPSNVFVGYVEFSKQARYTVQFIASF